MNRIPTAFAATLALSLAACGGSSDRSSGRIGPEGGSLTTGAVTLTVPAGALTQPTVLSLREAAPRAEAVLRVEIEPRGTELKTAAVVSVRSDDAARLKLVEIENEVEHGIEFERHNAARGTREAVVSRLGTVEARHAAVCLAGCAAGLECDDGACKPHGSDDGGVPPGAGGTCPAGWELDASDGLCKPHGGADGGVAPGAGGTCPAGWELDASDGVCKPHGGSSGGVAPAPGGTCPDGYELDASDGVCKPHGGSGGGVAPAPAPGGTCPDGYELDASDGVCKPHGGSGGGRG